jgi:hypothetical protein
MAFVIQDGRQEEGFKAIIACQGTIYDFTWKELRNITRNSKQDTQ